MKALAHPNRPKPRRRPVGAIPLLKRHLYREPAVDAKRDDGVEAQVPGRAGGLQVDAEARGGDLQRREDGRGGDGSVSRGDVHSGWMPWEAKQRAALGSCRQNKKKRNYYAFMAGLYGSECGSLLGSDL